MQPSCPHCSKGFSCKDNAIRHMSSTCHNKKDVLEPEEQLKHRMEMSLIRKRENIDILQHKVLCPESYEEISQSCYRAHLKMNRDKANACRFLEDDSYHMPPKTRKAIKVAKKVSSSFAEDMDSLTIDKSRFELRGIEDDNTDFGETNSGIVTTLDRVAFG
ncbi:hypothetical protein FQA39_LY16216 [Lamprigera yunnana]|nr:hypothetical protein FQA39_LY16216 [Lamprigera yunnana]